MSYVWCTWLADALRAEGCIVVEEGDWEHRGRPSSTGSFAPFGVLLHHTGATSSASNPFPSKNTLINGRSDLPGPLCQVGIGYDGKCHVIAAGRANHGGENRGSGPIPAGDANAQMIGVEIDYNGTQAISSAQKDAAVLVAVACLRRFDHGADYARIHAETSVTGKWDTGGVTGSTWRSLIGDVMAYPPPVDEPPEGVPHTMFMYRSPNGQKAYGVFDGVVVFMEPQVANAALTPLSGVATKPLYFQATADFVERLHDAGLTFAE